LGWTPDVAWSAAVPEILLAWDCKVEFLRNTNPLGAAGKAGGPPAPPPDETPEEKRLRIKAQIRGARG
jgi:hypothetical protein